MTSNRKHYRVVFVLGLILTLVGIGASGCGAPDEKGSSITTATPNRTDAAEAAAREVLEDLEEMKKRESMLSDGLSEVEEWFGSYEHPEITEKGKALTAAAGAIGNVLHSATTLAGTSQVLTDEEALPAMCRLKDLLEDVKRKAGEVDAGIDELDAMLQPFAEAEKLEDPPGNQWEIKIFGLHGSQGTLVHQAEGALEIINEALGEFSERCDALPPPLPSPTPMPLPTPTERPRNACHFTGPNPEDARNQVFWIAGEAIPVVLADIFPVAGGADCVLYKNGGGDRGWIPETEKDWFFDGYYQIRSALDSKVIITFEVKGTVG